MTTLNAGLTAHILQETTTVCTCWIVRRRDGVVMGFTDHDKPLSIEGVPCEAATGFQPTQAVSQLGLAPDNQDIAGALSADSITQLDLQAGRYDGARVEIWLVNWANPDEREHRRTAILGEVSRHDNAFTAELRSLTSLLDQKVGRVYARRCDAQLGDGRCRFNLNKQNYHALGQVSVVHGAVHVSSTGLEGYENGWFSHGNVTWTSGRNEGVSTEVASHLQSSGTLIFAESSPERPQIGDTFRITAGCDKQFSTCKTKFQNGINFQGFPHMPGTDFALGYPSGDDVHDGSPLIY